MRRRNLLQQFDPLATDREFESGKPSDVVAWRDSPKTIGLYAWLYEGSHLKDAFDLTLHRWPWLQFPSVAHLL
jgi:hypothetical protein